MSETEIHLSGGRTTTGIVRIGDTVRRPRTQNSEFVRSILLHLEAVGFDGAPRYLGTDEKNRDMFGYLSGEVPAELGYHDDVTLKSAGRLIRRYHDATVPFAHKDGAEVICHNDLSPCNTVFRDGRPIALIDFDAAFPGTRAYDLGYAAWLWLDIGNDDQSAPEQRRRLKVFLADYGLFANDPDIIKAMLVRQSNLITDGERTGNLAMSKWALKCQNWTLKHFPVPSPSPDVARSQ